MGIRVSHLTKRFGRFVAVDDVSFDIRTGEMVALLGPSGSGKSTILRLIAGLEKADAGELIIEGHRADQMKTRARGVGFVFQHYALFRHMTVGENIAFGLRVQGVSREERDRRVDELLHLVGLTGLAQRYPNQLSGGQRQRVALARALAPRPRLLLLDEPFGAIDSKVREELRQWLRRLVNTLDVTSIFVTHDQEEALVIADRVMILNGGRIEQFASPTEILDHPATEFVARFVGETNVLDAVVRDARAYHAELSLPADGFEDGTRVRLVIRIYDLKFWRDDDKGIATVTRVLPLGDRVKVEATLDGDGMVVSEFPRRSSLLKGIEPGCRIQIEVTSFRLYPMRPGATPESADDSSCVSPA